MPTYSVTDLGSFGGRSEALSLNSAGELVGYSEHGPTTFPSPTGFSYQTGVMTDLGALPGGGSSRALGVNASGVVAGWSDSSTIFQPVVWTNGSATILPAFGYGFNAAAAINDAGLIVGSVQKQASGSWEYPAEWTNGQLSILPSLPSGEAYAQTVNATGDVAGAGTTGPFQPTRAVLWTGGTIHDLSGAGSLAQAQGINATDQVVGESQACCDPLGNPTSNDQAMIWADGVARQVTQTPSPQTGDAFSINDAWQIVGEDGAAGGFVFENGTLHDLDSLLDAGSSGWHINYATAISADGVIAATGYQPATDPQGLDYHALLLTPSGSLNADSTPPTGTLTIDGGASTTATATVPVAAPGQDASGIFAVRLSNSAAVGGDGRLTLGKSFAPAVSISWSLTSATDGGTPVDGTKHVYAQWQDWRGNWSAPISASITLARPLAIISSSLSPASFARPSHTTFSFQTTKAAADTVQLRNSAGTVIRTWKLGTLSSAVHSVVWGGNLANGTHVPLGSYGMRLIASNGVTVTGSWHTVKLT